MLRPLAVTPGVTHFGAYHRPPDGHFLLYREGLIGPNFFYPNLTWLLSFGSLSFQTCLNPRGRPQPDWPITVHFWPVSIWPLHCSKIPSPGKTNLNLINFQPKSIYGLKSHQMLKYDHQTVKRKNLEFCWWASHQTSFKFKMLSVSVCENDTDSPFERTMLDFLLKLWQN